MTDREMLFCTLKVILKEKDIDPGPMRGKGTWDEFLKIHADNRVRFRLPLELLRNLTRLYSNGVGE